MQRENIAQHSKELKFPSLNQTHNPQVSTPLTLLLWALLSYLKLKHTPFQPGNEHCRSLWLPGSQHSTCLTKRSFNLNPAGNLWPIKKRPVVWDPVLPSGYGQAICPPLYLPNRCNQNDSRLPTRLQEAFESDVLQSLRMPHHPLQDPSYWSWAIPDPSQSNHNAIHLRVSLARWRTAVHFMLQKEPGSPIITKLRVIQLLGADINFDFQLLWGKRLVHNALAHNALSQWNFGVYPRARVQSALVLKTVSYDILHFTWHNAIILDNDTKACFARITPSLGLMATECLGMPQQATASTLATINGMHFYINTAHGFSKAITSQLQLH